MDLKYIHIFFQIRNGTESSHQGKDVVMDYQYNSKPFLYIHMYLAEYGMNFSDHGYSGDVICWFRISHDIFEKIWLFRCKLHFVVDSHVC